MNRTEKIKKRKRKKLRKSIIFFLLFLLLVVGGSVIYFTVQTINAANKAYNDLGREKSNLREETVSVKKDPFSVLLMGVEDYSTGGKNGRTDALLVATLNPEDQTMKLLSIPRDTLVEIVGEHTKDKITHAHVFGGNKMTIETVENLLDIPIDYYVSVDFDAFVNIIDILGGVEVNVPFDFTQDTLDGKIFKFSEGPMELDGEHALAYARMRKQDPLGDIGRNQRQQEIIKGIIDKITSIKNVTSFDDLATEIGENVETNFKVTHGLTLFKKYSNFSSNSIDQIELKTISDRYKGASVQVVDEDSLAETQATLKEHLQLDSSPATASTQK